MTIGQAAALGLIQGLTEFLPVSSRGHLVALSPLFGWAEPATEFTIAVHLGTLVAVVGYFWRDWRNIMTGRAAADRRLRWSLLVATVLTALAAWLFAPYRDRFVSPVLTAWLLLIFGLLLWLVDRQTRLRPAFTPKTGASAWLGLAQAVALLPGVSRSGIVITAARGLRLSRAAAVHYAFLLSAPIIALTPLALLTDLAPGVRPDWSLAVGFITAAVAGWLAIAGFLRLVQSLSFGWFTLYRAALGLVILWRL